MTYTVSQVSELTGITIRGLHHYDSIGLLSPALRTDSGYRLYKEADLERLQQIMLLKELGLGLEEIAAAIRDAGQDRELALENHKQMLLQKKNHIEGLLVLVDRSLDAIKGGRKMEMKELFDGFDPDEYKEEAREKYGDKYEESEKKTSKYTKRDWEAMKEESKGIMLAIVANMDKGPAHPEVTNLIARHRGHITKWFYECTLDIYRGLADLYLQDIRFTNSFEKIKPGLAAFMSEAMKAYVDKELSR